MDMASMEIVRGEVAIFGFGHVDTYSPFGLEGQILCADARNITTIRKGK